MVITVGYSERFEYRCDIFMWSLHVPFVHEGIFSRHSGKSKTRLCKLIVSSFFGPRCEYKFVSLRQTDDLMRVYQKSKSSWVGSSNPKKDSGGYEDKWMDFIDQRYILPQKYAH